MQRADEFRFRAIRKQHPLCGDGVLVSHPHVCHRQVLASVLRTVDLPAPIAEVLRSHIAHYVRDEPDALIFTGPTGRPLRRSNFNKLVDWEQARATLGVPHLHDLRHTGNTLAAGTPGTSTRNLMERMGHDSVRAALIYQHATRDAGRRIADSLQGRDRGAPVVR